MVKHLSSQPRRRNQYLGKSGKRVRTITRMLTCNPKTVGRYVHATQIIDCKKKIDDLTLKNILINYLMTLASVSTLIFLPINS